MMKTGYLIVLIVNSFFAGKCPTVQEARLLYKQAANSKSTCNDFIARLQSCSATPDPVLRGYQAAATMMMAKHAGDPFSKLSWFRKGRKLLDNTLSQHGQNVELRFLRFTIQTNAPGILGYNGEIDTDKSFLLNAVGQLTDAALRQLICDYLRQSKQVSEQEKELLPGSCKGR